MGVKGYWTDVLGLFKYRRHERLSPDDYATVAIDAEILMCKSRTELTEYATTNMPPYPSPDILGKVKEYHAGIVAEKVHPIYVFGGPAPRLKKEEKERRVQRRADKANAWTDLLEKLGEDSNTPLSDTVVADAIAGRKQLCHPTVLDHANVISWMRDEGIRVVGSFLEADQQLRKLEIDGVADAIATEDGDLVVLGGEKVLSKSKTEGGRMTFRPFLREELSAAQPYDRHLAKFFLYPEARIELALLLGNDYFDKMEGNGPVTVLEEHDRGRQRKNKPANKGGKRSNAGLIDLAAKHVERGGHPEDWFRDYAINNSSRIPKSAESVDQYVERYKTARRYMLHAPVFEKNEQTGEITLVPLNPLPAGVDIAQWKEYIGFDFEEDGAVGEHQYGDVYNCNLIPLTGKRAVEHRGPLYSARENQKVSTNEVLPLFGRLDFDAVPVELQPTVCLKHWLMARGWTERASDTRESIERAVHFVRELGHVVHEPEMQLSVGEYNAMEVLTYRDANNKYDTWNGDYYTICKKILPVDANVLSPKLVALLGNSHRRSKLLVQGKHYNPKTIRCLNVASKQDGSPCILMRCECLGSRKAKIIHTVHAVFEDKIGGKFLLSPFSTCSCGDGALFCSHMKGFLEFLRLVQDEPSQEAFEEWYVADQLLILATGAPIETVVMMDKFHREVAQSTRQAKSKKN